MANHSYCQVKRPFDSTFISFERRSQKTSGPTFESGNTTENPITMRMPGRSSPYYLVNAPPYIFPFKIMNLLSPSVKRTSCKHLSFQDAVPN